MGSQQTALGVVVVAIGVIGLCPVACGSIPAFRNICGASIVGKRLKELRGIEHGSAQRNRHTLDTVTGKHEFAREDTRCLSASGQCVVSALTSSQVDGGVVDAEASLSRESHSTHQWCSSRILHGSHAGSSLANHTEVSEFASINSLAQVVSAILDTHARQVGVGLNPVARARCATHVFIDVHALASIGLGPTGVIGLLDHDALKGVGLTHCQCHRNLQSLDDLIGLVLRSDRNTEAFFAKRDVALTRVSHGDVSKLIGEVVIHITVGINPACIAFTRDGQTWHVHNLGGAIDGKVIKISIFAYDAYALSVKVADCHFGKDCTLLRTV